MFTLFGHEGSDAPWEMSYILINTATFPSDTTETSFTGMPLERRSCKLQTYILQQKNSTDIRSIQHDKLKVMSPYIDHQEPREGEEV
jgi:hypothetical protein